MEKERKNFQLNYHHQVSEIPFCPSEASIHFILGSNRSNKDALIKLGAVAPIIPADGKLRQGVASHPKHSTFYDSLGYKVRFCLKKSSKQTTKYKMLCYVCTVACRHDFQIWLEISVAIIHFSNLRFCAGNTESTRSVLAFGKME